MATNHQNKYDIDNLAPMLQADIPLKDVDNPTEIDVLCGRGGATHKHQGNQTYRRLVQLNKAHYATCAKTDKIKISRSIVAAFRQQNGRFLEKDKSGTWCDIGDKKAIEKTSQALREGQPKLQKKAKELKSSGSSNGTSADVTSALLQYELTGKEDVAPNNDHQDPAKTKQHTTGMIPDSVVCLGAEKVVSATDANKHRPGLYPKKDLPVPTSQPSHKSFASTISDDMPDIHPVESSRTLMSDISKFSSNDDPDIKALTTKMSAMSAMSGLSNISELHPPETNFTSKEIDELVNVVAAADMPSNNHYSSNASTGRTTSAATRGEFSSADSKRSLMSGISKMSEFSAITGISKMSLDDDTINSEVLKKNGLK